jgi:N-acyl-D-aspartate/D-glutamate deacylase
LEGGVDALVSRIREAGTRARLKGEIEATALAAHPAEDIEFVGPVTGSTATWGGMRLSAIAARIGKTPAEVILDIVSETRNTAMAIEFSANEDDLRLALETPWITFDTDYQASAVDGRLADANAHPRAFGTTARLLAHYVRDEHVLSLEEAVRRLSSLPAKQLGLRDRGAIAPGMRADLVVFDLAHLHDEASYEAPKRYPSGIDYVVVNGQLVVAGGTVTDARPGEPVRHLTPPPRTSP